MKKKDLISKWLDNNLTDKELETFKQLDVFSSYQRISEAAKQFEAPEFDAHTSYEGFTNQRPEKTRPTYPYQRYIATLAAALVLSVGVYFFFFYAQQISFHAENADRLALTLPDTSEVILNADSNISYSEKGWDSNRGLSLEGEAYFKVAKGAKFTVHTSQGDISVLGTQFNVKNRNDYFEVTCYEGLVQVTYDGKIVPLPASNTFRILNGVVQNEITQLKQPAWVHKKSIFRSIPLKQVLEEVERQYNIAITSSDIDENIIFTGSFSHENLETAIQAIAIPLKLAYTIEGETVSLKK